MYFLTKPTSVDRQVAELAEPDSFLRTEYRGFAKIREGYIKERVQVHGCVDNFIDQRFGFRDKIETKSDHRSEAGCYLAVWAYDQLDVDREQVNNELYRYVPPSLAHNG